MKTGLYLQARGGGRNIIELQAAFDREQCRVDGLGYPTYGFRFDRIILIGVRDWINEHRDSKAYVETCRRWLDTLETRLLLGGKIIEINP